MTPLAAIATPAALVLVLALVLGSLGGAVAQPPSTGSCFVSSTLAGPPRMTPSMGFGIAVNKAGVVFVSDPSSNEILSLAPPLYAPLPFIGSQDTPGRFNGVGTNALLNRPWDVIFGESGILYFTDQGNAMIRAIDTIKPNAEVFTVCGGNSAADDQNDGACLVTATFTRFIAGMAFDFSRKVLYMVDSDRVRAILFTTAGDGIPANFAKTISRPSPYAHRHRADARRRHSLRL